MGTLVERLRAFPDNVLEGASLHEEAAAHIERLEDDLRNIRRERDEWHGRAAESVRLRRERDEFAADARRWRYARQFLTIDDVEDWQRDTWAGRVPSGLESERADAAVDEALSRNA